MRFYYKLLLFLLVIIPLDEVMASSISVNCPSGGILGEVITCELNGQSDEEISAVRTNLSVSDNLEFISFEVGPNWQGNGDNGVIYLYTYPNKIDNFKIGTVKLKIKEVFSSKTGTINFKDVYFYKADFSRVAGEDISKNIKILSTNNNLSNLSLVGYTISPNFDKNVTEYMAIVESDVVAIEASAEDENASISGIGRKELNYGDNVFVVVVTSESGSKKEYKLIINRPEDKKEEDDSKEEVDTSDKEEEKEDDKKEESPDIEVDDNKPNLDDSGNQQEGNNNVESGNPVQKDGNSKLKSLVIDGYEIEFNSEIYQYYIDVSSGVNSLNINAIPGGSNARVVINGNANLAFGKNEIIINVVAENGHQSNYFVYVMKKSDVCVIQDIKILGYDLNFDCNVYDYELEISIEDCLNIDVVSSNEGAKVNIYNNSDLDHEDEIKVVASLDGIDYKYNIKILKSGFRIGKLFSNKQLIIISCVLVITSGYIIVRMLLKKKLFKNIEK